MDLTVTEASRRPIEHGRSIHEIRGAPTTGWPIALSLQCGSATPGCGHNPGMIGHPARERYTPLDLNVLRDRLAGEVSLRAI